MKRETIFKTAIRAAFVGFVFCLGAQSAQAQMTVFTYQGRLTDSSLAASGTYDFQFALYDAAIGGAQQPQPTPITVTRSGVNVSNGVFTVQLDFGANPFASGANRFLEIAVKRPADANFTTLAPRQQLTSAPFSIQSFGAKTSDALSAACLACVTNAQISEVDGAKVTGTVANATNAANAASATSAANATNAANLGNVAAANYLLKNGDGSGLTNLPVRLLPWETVTAATKAQPNRGYIAANDAAQVVITLPASPNVGDVVRVAGAGASGFRISQSANQSINGANLGLSAWTPRESNRDWISVASSSDGTKLVAVVYGGRIYTSTDSGVTWTPRESIRNWWAVASSSDGTKLVAVVQGGQIYTSVDAGATWTARESNRNWWSVASSSDGTRLAAVAYNGQIYTSTDSGATWTPRESNRFWKSIASSSDGTKLVAAVTGGQIYTSTDSGVTWTPRESIRDWISVASSSDATKLVAVVNGGQIFTSVDSGATWTARESSRNWWSVASSADGAKLVAAVTGGRIYTSTDSGATWMARESSRFWISVASSSDGTRLVAVVDGGQIYTATYGTSSTGAAGYLTGEQNSAIELLYVGGGKFVVVNSQGTINSF